MEAQLVAGACAPAAPSMPLPLPQLRRPFANAGGRSWIWIKSERCGRERTWRRRRRSCVRSSSDCSCPPDPEPALLEKHCIRLVRASHTRQGRHSLSQTHSAAGMSGERRPAQTIRLGSGYLDGGWSNSRELHSWDGCLSLVRGYATAPPPWRAPPWSTSRRRPQRGRRRRGRRGLRAAAPRAAPRPRQSRGDRGPGCPGACATGAPPALTKGRGRELC